MAVPGEKAERGKLQPKHPAGAELRQPQSLHKDWRKDLGSQLSDTSCGGRENRDVALRNQRLIESLGDKFVIHHLPAPLLPPRATGCSAETRGLLAEPAKLLVDAGLPARCWCAVETRLILPCGPPHPAAQPPPRLVLIKQSQQYACSACKPQLPGSTFPIAGKHRTPLLAARRN